MQKWMRGAKYNKRKVKDVKCSICRPRYLKWKHRNAVKEND
jgi:hypothetical protein